LQKWENSREAGTGLIPKLASSQTKDSKKRLERIAATQQGGGGEDGLKDPKDNAGGDKRLKSPGFRDQRAIGWQGKNERTGLWTLGERVRAEGGISGATSRNDKLGEGGMARRNLDLGERWYGWGNRGTF